jgi:hypothetical protein
MHMENIPGLLSRCRRACLAHNAPRLFGAFLLFAACGAGADNADDPSRGKATAHNDKLFSFTDTFDRPNSNDIGEKWVDCHKDKPANFEPLAIYDNGIVIADPKTRPGVYDTTPPSGHPPTNNRIYPGMGCAWTETGATRVSVKIMWSGNLGINHPPPISHVEATPLLYINPGHPRYGFGAWTSQMWNRPRPIIYAGYIGSPPERFEIIAGGFYPGKHIPGTVSELELRAEEPGKVTVWMDGKQISFNEGYDLQPLDVDPTMIHSTLHGFAVDAHFVDPVSNVPFLKAIESIQIQALH